jgi:hypothetical protein
MIPDRKKETTVVIALGTFFGLAETDILALEVDAAAGGEPEPPSRPDPR